MRRIGYRRRDPYARLTFGIRLAKDVYRRGNSAEGRAARRYISKRFFPKLYNGRVKLDNKFNRYSFYRKYLSIH